MTENKNYKIKNKEEKPGEVTLDIELEKDFLEKYKDKAIENLGKDVEVKGFRKGMAPKEMILEKVGEMSILEEQTHQALQDILPSLVISEKIEALTAPKITITKIAVGSNLEFKASFALMPKVDLADYKKIAKSIKKADKIEVTTEEIDKYIEYIRKNKAEAEYLKKKTSGEKVDESEKEKLPELNDEFVKSLGNFKDLEDFKQQLKENMQKDKEIHEKGKRRTEIMEKIIEGSKIDMPDLIIEDELDRMTKQYQADIEQTGIKFEDYLKEIKKTTEDLRKEWRADAVKRAKMNLILPKIAKSENISAEKEHVDTELKLLMKQHDKIDENSARLYLGHILTNEKVFEFLETL